MKRAIRRKKREERQRTDREISDSVRSTKTFWTKVRQRWKTEANEFRQIRSEDGKIHEEDASMREEVKKYMTELGRDEDDERTNEEDRFDMKMRERITEELKRMTKERGSTPHLKRRY